MHPGELRPANVPELGTVLDGKYRVIRDLASGAMGRLMEAEHVLLERRVAIKFVSSTPDARSRRRMMQEARAAQQLSSEHVVRVFDVGLFGDSPYIVMELLEGSDLGAILEARGALPVHDAIDYVLQACVGLAEAHASNVIHRDIKPSNLFSSKTATGARTIKVLDFGISKVGGAAGDERATGERTADDSLLGSPYYMSPEQLRNPTRVDARTDVWSLAVTLYQLLTGAYPFEGTTVNEISAAIFTEHPKDIAELRPELPVALQRAVARALAKRPEERTPSVVALARDLAPFGTSVGKLAAERLAAPGAVHDEPEPGQVVVRSGERTSTIAELGSTLPALSSDKSAQLEDAERAPPSPQRRIGMFVLAGAAATIGAVALLGWWARAPAQEPVTATSGSAIDPTVVTPEPPPPRPVQSSAPAPSPPPPASAAVETRQPAPRVAAKRPASAPPPKPAAAKPSARPAASSTLDIDGVPIVE